MTPRSRALLLSISALLPMAGGCSDSQAQAPAPAADPNRVLSDRPLEPFQVEMLDVAFEAVTALPVDPHIKNRSRAQEAVVAACFELEQPGRALRYIERIDNWRRGVGYADLAYYLAERGHPAIREYLDRARAVAADYAADPNAQPWRVDRIHATIARTHVLLGQTAEADQLSAGLQESETIGIAVARARASDTGAFDGQVRSIDAAIATGNFDQMRGALEACAALFDRYYNDGERRGRMEERITLPDERIPIMVRLELIMKIAGFALDHGDQTAGLRLVDEAQRVADGASWLPEAEVALQARLAGLRHRAGAHAEARRQCDASLALFDAQEKNIVNFSRAGALRPVAEAYHTMGDIPAALGVYKRAAEVGAINPNGRPRAVDLSATCTSIAVHGIEPDDELRQRLLSIRSGLTAPW